MTVQPVRLAFRNLKYLSIGVPRILPHNLQKTLFITEIDSALLAVLI